MNKLAQKALSSVLYSCAPPINENIVEWATHRDWDVRVIHEPFVLETPSPRGNLPPNVARRYAIGSRVGLPAQYLVCIPDGMAYGGGFTRLPSGEFLLESAWRPQYLLESNIYRARFRRHRRKLKGDFCNLHTYFSGNWGHWLYDDLPRIANALLHLPASTQFLVHPRFQQWKVESLRAIGIDSSRFVETNVYEEIQCERLWFVGKLGDSEKCASSPQVCRNLSERLRAQVSLSSVTDSGQPKRIFVTRSKTAKPRILNEAELFPMLRRHEFEIVAPEEHSFDEQRQIFHSCEYVMGSFGAALTNIIFASPSATMVDIQEDGSCCPRLWYWKLSHVFGRSYKTIIAENNGGSGWGSSTMRIHPEKAETALKAILGAQKAEDSCDFFEAK